MDPVPQTASPEPPHSPQPVQPAEPVQPDQPAPPAQPIIQPLQYSRPKGKGLLYALATLGVLLVAACGALAMLYGQVTTAQQSLDSARQELEAQRTQIQNLAAQTETLRNAAKQYAELKGESCSDDIADCLNAAVTRIEQEKRNAGKPLVETIYGQLGIIAWKEQESDFAITSASLYAIPGDTKQNRLDLGLKITTGPTSLCLQYHFRRIVNELGDMVVPTLPTSTFDFKDTGRPSPNACPNARTTYSDQQVSLFVPANEKNFLFRTDDPFQKTTMYFTVKILEKSITVEKTVKQG